MKKPRTKKAAIALAKTGSKRKLQVYPDSPAAPDFELEKICKRNVGGRPRTEISPLDVEKLSRLGCTDPDMAYWFGCSVRTIARRRADGGLTAAVWQRGRSGAHVGGRPRNPGPRQVIGSHTLLDVGGPWRKHPETSS